MKRSEVNKDPDRARKRAITDLRCAAKKLAPHLHEKTAKELLDLVAYIAKDLQLRGLAWRIDLYQKGQQT